MSSAHPERQDRIDATYMTGIFRVYAGFDKENGSDEFQSICLAAYMAALLNSTHELGVNCSPTFFIKRSNA